MGAKPPEKLKLQRPDCKCDVCGRKFLNKPALTSHRKFVHKTEGLPAKGVAIKKETAPKQEKVVNVVTRTVATRSEVKKVEKMPAPKVTEKSDSKPENDTPEVKTQTPKKIEFKCPKCAKLFSVYFSAYRHIQKYHCVDDNDDPVPPSSPFLIKPVHIEKTPCCNEWVKELETETHTCMAITQELTDSYMCLGCQQTFDNLLIFDHHVKGLHSTGAEYFFFPNNIEFTSWKMDLEEITKIKFVTLSNKQKSKQTYHCSFQPSLKTEKTLLCPASLHISEFKNGYQVTYYKEHFGHSCADIPPSKYKKYSINLYFNDVSMQNVDNDDTMYQQFKNIMNTVTINAATVNIDVLNTLFGKALEMTVALNMNILDDDTSNLNKTMTDEEISDVLADEKTNPGKRKSDILRSNKKSSPENNENNKLNNTLPNKSLKLKKDERTPLSRPFNQSPSFNDSYKNFVDQNFKKSSVKKKMVMKTKMGQFKVKPSIAPKSPEESLSPKPSNSLELKLKPDFKYEVKEQENDCNILILKI